MTEERFTELMAAASKAFHAYRDAATKIAGSIGTPTHLSEEEARRQYRQALDVLSVEATPEQWARVEAAMTQRWP